MTKKSKTSKRAKKPSSVKDLPAKSASAVKGGAISENVSLNFAKIAVEYRPQGTS